MVSDRFDRFLPLAGVLAGLLFFVGLALLWNDPASETGPAETFAYWQDNHGQHQIVAILVAPLIAFFLLFFGVALWRRLAQGNGDGGHGSVAFGGSLLAAATFVLVAMLEAAMSNAAHEGERNTVYTLNQLHSYDWLGVERGVRGDAPRDRPRRSPQRDAADAACVGDDRDRSVAPDAARVLRIHPRARVADRGRGLALPASDGRAASWLGRGRARLSVSSRS